MIEYRTSAGDLVPAQLVGFFEGWGRVPSPETHLELLHRSDEIVLALDAVEDRVVGFVTAITDGILAAYIPLLEVLPAHRKRGIGSELVRRVLARLSGLYMVDLTCDPRLASYYSRFGMTGLASMAIRDARAQAGRNASSPTAANATWRGHRKEDRTA